MDDARKEYLSSIYYDLKKPGSFQGVGKLYRAVRERGYTRKNIEDWLVEQDIYTTTKEINNRRFPRTKVLVNGLDELWDADLIDLQSLSEENDGVNYLLVAIDIFSRYLSIRPLKSKHARNVIDAFNSIFSTSRKPLKYIRTDGGSEFTNKAMENYLANERKLVHIVTNNETQANYAERVIKTVKSKLYRYIVHNQTTRYVDVIQDLVRGYNDTYHRSIKRSPASVNETNIESVKEILQRRVNRKIKKYKFSINDSLVILEQNLTRPTPKPTRVKSLL
ncbi:MAG: transposase family protein [Gammaproteobacteria bacterium]|nr:transposase family protein [Gammaproteobacteria bacterium]